MNDNVVKIKKHKFNIIDIAAIIILVAIAVFFLLLADPFEWIADKADSEVETTINCVVSFDDISKSEKHIIGIADIAQGYINEKQYMSTVIDINRIDSTKWVEDKTDGTLKLENAEGKERVYVTMQIKCTYKPGEGYFINDEPFWVGSTVCIKFPNCQSALIGECISIEVNEGGIVNAEEK